MKTFFLVYLFLLQPTAAFSSIITIPSHEGNRDAATVILPENLSSSASLPVVLLLHGYSGSGNSANNHFGLSHEVNRRGFILVLPNGRKSRIGMRYWNATDACCDFDHSRGDDVNYLVDLLKEVALRAPVDQARIYVTGHSNGGFMVHRLACDTKGVFAAFASFAGATFKNAGDCKESGPVSMLQIHAVDDRTVKFTGDERGFPSMSPYPGAEASISRWVEKNSCPGNPETRGAIDLIRSIPEKDTEVQRWNNCAGGNQVELWKIKAFSGNGHNAHTPSLTVEFRDALLGFLLNKKRSN